MAQRSASYSERLIYIEQMLEELGKMAKETDSPLLAYMIEMALQEARDCIDATADG
ncbi:hypothetical protein H7Q97_08435 [Ochrobactrum sp. CM-21-5]|nr:hypothetical protein [Ochrobactrum sp. CM-21-5]MBC2885433.1 hypothetical protein [Ochrobactrum sp. CM-21-5]